MRLRPFGHWASRGSAPLRVDLKDTCGNYLIALANIRVDGCHIAHLVYNRWTKPFFIALGLVKIKLRHLSILMKIDRKIEAPVA